jgi:hypothetical protein
MIDLDSWKPGRAFRLRTRWSAMTHNPRATTVAAPYLLALLLLLAWNWAAVVIIAAVLGLCWRSGRRAERRRVARRLSR